jgi:hypothetical protein
MTTNNKLIITLMADIWSHLTTLNDSSSFHNLHFSWIEWEMWPSMYSARIIELVMIWLAVLRKFICIALQCQNYVSVLS